jgi:hypothetical protein
VKKKRLCPQRVADACLESAWLDDIPDQVRMHLEHAHDVIEHLMARCIASAKVLEVVEAELASMKYPLLDDDDPGMAL